MNFEIDGKTIGDGNPVYIIAEAGVNHKGKIELALEMVECAKEAKVDAIKFQTFKTENLVLKGAPQAEYQKKFFKSRDQFNMLKSLELNEEDFKKIKKRCDELEITFLSTPFDEESVETLEGLKVKAYKIGSGDFNNILLLKKIAKTKKPVIFSTGMSDIYEIKRVLKIIDEMGIDKKALLHCVSSYPTRYEDINLNVIASFKKEFPIPVGLSDHTLGIHIPIAATVLGVNIIEKHFTLDKRMKGPDHKASLNFKELKEMVQRIREVELSLGDGFKRVQQVEEKVKEVARKSLVAKVPIRRGETISEEMITAKRPATGINPLEIGNLLGKKAKIDIEKDTILKWEMFE